MDVTDKVHPDEGWFYSDIVKKLRRISPVNIDVDKLNIHGEKVYVN